MDFNSKSIYRGLWSQFFLTIRDYHSHSLKWLVTAGHRENSPSCCFDGQPHSKSKTTGKTTFSQATSAGQQFMPGRGASEHRQRQVECTGTSGFYLPLAARLLPPVTWERRGREEKKIALLELVHVTRCCLAGLSGWLPARLAWCKQWKIWWKRRGRASSCHFLPQSKIM